MGTIFRTSSGKVTGRSSGTKKAGYASYKSSGSGSSSSSSSSGSGKTSPPKGSKANPYTPEEWAAKLDKERRPVVKRDPNVKSERVVTDPRSGKVVKRETVYKDNRLVVTSGGKSTTYKAKNNGKLGTKDLMQRAQYDRQQKLINTLKKGGKFETEMDRIEALALSQGKVYKEALEPSIKRIQKKKGTRAALDFAIKASKFVNIQPVKPTGKLLVTKKRSIANKNNEQASKKAKETDPAVRSYFFSQPFAEKTKQKIQSEIQPAKMSWTKKTKRKIINLLKKGLTPEAKQRLAQNEALRSTSTVPVIKNGKVVGTKVLYNTGTGKAMKLIDEATLAMIGGIATKLGTATLALKTPRLLKTAQTVLAAAYIESLPSRIKNKSPDELVMEFAPDVVFATMLKGQKKEIQKQALKNVQKHFPNVKKRMPNQKLLNEKLRKLDPKEAAELEQSLIYAFSTKQKGKVSALAKVLNKAKVLYEKDNKKLYNKLKKTDALDVSYKRIAVKKENFFDMLKFKKKKNTEVYTTFDEVNKLKIKELDAYKGRQGMAKLIFKKGKLVAVEVLKVQGKDKIDYPKTLKKGRIITKSKTKRTMKRLAGEPIAKSERLYKPTKKPKKPKVEKVKTKKRKIDRRMEPFKPEPKEEVTKRLSSKKLRKIERKEILERLANEIPENKKVKYKGKKASRKEFRKLIIKKDLKGKLPEKRFDQIDELIKVNRLKKFPRITKSEYSKELKQTQNLIKDIDVKIADLKKDINSINKYENTFGNQFAKNVNKDNIKSLLSRRKALVNEIIQYMDNNKQFLSEKQKRKLIRLKAGKQDRKGLIETLNKFLQEQSKIKQISESKKAKGFKVRPEKYGEATKKKSTKKPKPKKSITKEGQILLTEKSKKIIQKPKKAQPTIQVLGQKNIRILPFPKTKEQALQKLKLSLTNMSKQKIKSKPKQKQANKSISKLIEKIKQQPKIKIIQKLNIKDQQKLINKVIQKLNQKQTTISALGQKTVQKQKIVTPIEVLDGKIRIPDIVTPPPIIPPKLKKEIEEEIAKLKKSKKRKLRYVYTATISGLGKRATRTVGPFTGFEVRGSQIILKPIKVKKHKRKSLVNKAFVRRHRRKKPKS